MELKSNDLGTVEKFLRDNAHALETAELSIRSSAGLYIAQLRSTEEPAI
jgi:hypothetical protein